MNKLTPRQTQIAKLVAKGLSNQEIADQLGVQYSTVKLHVHHILSRLGFDRRAKVILLAQKHPSMLV